MQVNVTITRLEIMALVDNKMAEDFPNLMQVVRDYADRVPEVINLKITLKKPKEASER